MANQWYVIAGAPSSGKTTIINELGLLGYTIIEEAARILITSNLEKGISIEEMRKDDKSFQKEIMDLRLRLEGDAPSDSPAFFDTAIPDNLAYYKLCGLDTAEMEEFSKDRYKKIFLLEPLPLEKDGIRVEDEMKRRELYDTISEIYSRIGYELIMVPSMPVKERISFILSNISNDM